MYGLTGTTMLDGIGEYIRAEGASDRSMLVLASTLLIAGFGFKMAVVPFQMWVPDVYQGAPTPVAAFLSVGSKAAAFAVVIRIFFGSLNAEFLSDDWSMIYAVLAAVSMTVGNIMAIVQTDIKRMLGYSSVAQAGNILVGARCDFRRGRRVRVGRGRCPVLPRRILVLRTWLRSSLVIAISQQRINSDTIADYAGMWAPVADSRVGTRRRAHFSHRHPAHRWLLGQDLHLQRRHSSRHGVARDHWCPEQRCRRVLLSRRGTPDVPRSRGGGACGSRGYFHRSRVECGPGCPPPRAWVAIRHRSHAADRRRSGSRRIVRGNSRVPGSPRSKSNSPPQQTDVDVEPLDALSRARCWPARMSNPPALLAVPPHGRRGVAGPQPRLPRHRRTDRCALFPR